MHEPGTDVASSQGSGTRQRNRSSLRVTESGREFSAVRPGRADCALSKPLQWAPTNVRSRTWTHRIAGSTLEYEVWERRARAAASRSPTWFPPDSCEAVGPKFDRFAPSQRVSRSAWRCRGARFGWLAARRSVFGTVRTRAARLLCSPSSSRCCAAARTPRRCAAAVRRAAPRAFAPWLRPRVSSRLCRRAPRASRRSVGGPCLARGVQGCSARTAPTACATCDRRTW